MGSRGNHALLENVHCRKPSLPRCRVHAANFEKTRLPIGTSHRYRWDTGDEEEESENTSILRLVRDSCCCRRRHAQDQAKQDAFHTRRQEIETTSQKMRLCG